MKFVGNRWRKIHAKELKHELPFLLPHSYCSLNRERRWRWRKWGGAVARFSFFSPTSHCPLFIPKSHKQSGVREREKIDGGRWAGWLVEEEADHVAGTALLASLIIPPLPTGSLGGANDNDGRSDNQARTNTSKLRDGNIGSDWERDGKIRRGISEWMGIEKIVVIAQSLIGPCTCLSL